MAEIAIMAGGALMAVGIAWVGVQGLRGVPDSKGKATAKSTAVACLVIAAALAIAAFSAPVWIGD